MNQNLLQNCIETIRKDLRTSLLASDIYSTKTGMSIIGFNSKPAACKMFNSVTQKIKTSLAGSGFPSLKDFYFLNIEGGNLVLVIDLKEYQWGMLIDSTDLKVNHLLNVTIPNAKQAFTNAVGD